MHRLILFVLFFGLYVVLHAQDRETGINAKKIDQAPIIDGQLNEDFWMLIQGIDDYTELEPDPGAKPESQTKVYFAYDDQALYVGAILYDKEPGKMVHNLSSRDDQNIDAEVFAVTIDPIGNASQAFEFWLTSAGVQTDKFLGKDFESVEWDAVWYSQHYVGDFGWSVEFKIPFSALRFPKEAVSDWKIITWRHNRRIAEWSSWPPLDPEGNSILVQAGSLRDIKINKTPIRLFITPYLSAYTERDKDGNWGKRFNGGADLKYGINESFTLDMTLIPDFSQVQSDDQVLNLSPFEVFFEERRQFFTEGTELFNKGEIFYSRRVGSTPKRYDSVEDQLKTNEVIISNPQKTNMINATKLTGRTKSGLGIGFFNAITAPSNASVQIGIGGEIREIETQPLTNYNLIVFDQDLRNNSSVSFTNANVVYLGDNTPANVMALTTSLLDKKQKYQLNGNFKWSRNYQNDILTNGHSYLIKFKKASGKFRWGAIHYVENDTYDPNDFGYLQANNELSNEVFVQYRTYKPKWIFLDTYQEIEINQKFNYSPRDLVDIDIEYSTRTTLKNRLSLGGNINIHPIVQHDYFETRTAERYFSKTPYSELGVWYSSDYRKRLALDGRFSFAKDFSERNQTYYSIRFAPRIRLSNKILMKISATFEQFENNFGYVDSFNDSIFFARRNDKTVPIVFDMSYIFTNKLSLSLRARHYWARIEYLDFYSLENEGDLTSYPNYQHDNINFNVFNVDMLLKWQFAPGSELVLSWKNWINQEDAYLINNYIENFNHTITNPQSNSLSLRLLYHIDYHVLKVSRIKSKR